ncbi:Fmt Methionyl-tRNA formyltransferase [Candidatus Nanopelagicaceae bacterium]
MRIALAATPEVGIPTLEWLQSSEHELVAVITQPDRPAGRGRTLTATPVAVWAHAQSLPLHKTDSVTDLLSIARSVDLLITIGYGVMLPADVLSAPRFGCINLHFSLLPSWRGAAPVQRSIEAGDSFTGVTVFAMDEGMDTGPIYTQMRYALDQDITADELFVELSHLGVSAIEESLALIYQGKKPTPQKESGVSRAFKLSKAEGSIDWNNSAEEVSAKIRAFTSNPGAWTTINETVLKIDSVSISDEVLSPGEISLTPSSVHIGTATNALLIEGVTPAGKSHMKAADWARGARLSPGAICG